MVVQILSGSVLISTSGCQLSQKANGSSAGRHFPAYILYGYGDAALLLHPHVVELQGELQDDDIASTSPFLPLMHTWTYRTCEGPPGGPPHVKIIRIFMINFI